MIEKSSTLEPQPEEYIERGSCPRFSCTGLIIRQMETDESIGYQLSCTACGRGRYVRKEFMSPVKPDANEVKLSLNKKVKSSLHKKTGKIKLSTVYRPDGIPNRAYNKFIGVYGSLELAAGVSDEDLLSLNGVGHLGIQALRKLFPKAKEPHNIDLAVNMTGNKTINEKLAIMCDQMAMILREMDREKK